MNISTTSTAASGADRQSQAQSKLASSFDGFLTLLTAQLQHQDPLSPLDATEFTNQLVQFSSVEQAIEQNRQLKQLTQLIEGNTLTSALGFIGTEVAFDAEQIVLPAEGDARLDYEAPQGAARVTVTVRDNQGELLHQEDLPASAGTHAFVWNGRGANGERVAAGAYRLQLDAVDAAGKSLEVQREARGRVDGVEAGPDGLLLSIGAIQVMLDQVRSVSRPVLTQSSTEGSLS